MTNKNLIIKDLKKHLQKQFGDNIKDVILFGSHASNKFTNDSDYDILILLKNRPDWKLKRLISDYCYNIDLKYNIITDIHIISDPELNTLRGKQPIFYDAIHKGIHA